MAGSDIQLSKTLSWLLRHGAVDAGLSMSEDGFVSVAAILRHSQFKQFSQEDVFRVVKTNNKQRYFVKEEPIGEFFIRANQGHSIDTKVEMTQIRNAGEVPVVLHGTYSKFWPSIQSQGLSRMRRQHVHFTTALPQSGQVISGMRGNCDIVIYIDHEKAMADGIQFYRSANDVILTPGDENGFIQPKYFLRVINRSSGQLIWEPSE